jgi:hypothetical protein
MRIQIPLLLVLSTYAGAIAADQTKLGEGNIIAQKTGPSSPLVQAAMRVILKNVRAIRDETLRDATLDALRNPATCVAHRVRVTDEVKASILKRLTEEGLLLENKDAKTGVFPPLTNEGSACPQLPLMLNAAPGSGLGGHHSYPGGLAVHEAFNLQSALNFAMLYRKMFGNDVSINRDFVIGAPAWHDWAKTMVLQWNADGGVFDEFNFGGAGRTDNYGSAGDSRTGAHHILGLAETMARGLAPGLVITQASAHAAPTLGNEYKVVNWLRAAALIARIDPAAKGYLVIDKDGRWRLPPLNHLWDGLDLNKNGQTNLLPEYPIHNLSDADFVQSIPAVTNAELLLKTVAKQFGYDPAETATYNNKFRNVVLAFVGPERLSFTYSSYGLDAVVRAISRLKERKLI